MRIAVRGCCYLRPRPTRYLLPTQENWNLLLHAGTCGDAMTMNILADHDLNGLNVQARSSTLTAADTFRSRPDAVAESMLMAFKNLVAVVKRNTANMRLGEVV